MFKNRNFQIGAGAVLLIVIITGGYFFFAGKSQKVESEPTVAQDTVVQNISGEDIGLKLQPSPDKKKIKIILNKDTSIKSIAYELTYEADSTAQEKNEGGELRVQRGITGDIKIDSGKSTYESEWLDLGSCSRNVCRYDTGVNSIDVTLKIVKKDGKIYEASESLEL